MNYYTILAIVVLSLVFLLSIICLLLELYDSIYAYVCKQLDQCNYFGEDK